VAWQPVDDQRRTLRGQPQVKVASSIEATADQAVTRLVSGAFVS
jgi:hypothetical protein